MYDIVFYEPTCHTIHAEQSCISKCSKKLISKATLLLVRKSPTDKIGPCEKCMKIINKYKIKNIICCWDISL